MEISEAIKGRRSVRRFKPEPVPREVIENILELAQWAPSAMNQQDWRFIEPTIQFKNQRKQVFPEPKRPTKSILKGFSLIAKALFLPTILVNSS